MKKCNILPVLIFLLMACTPATTPNADAPTPINQSEEASVRLDTATEDAISTLQNRLQANDADTFAGLWIQHEPEYHIIVAFTRDGEETIQQYVVDDSELAQLIEVRSAEYTLAQLEADQQAAIQILDTIQQSAGIGIMMMDNRVVVDITDRASFEAALVEANVTLPKSVIVNAIYEPLGEDPPFDIKPPPSVFMPQLKQRDAVFMEALLIGELVVQDGCLRINNENGSTLIIWQADYYLTDNNSILAILDEKGTVVAQIGEIVYMGGGEQPAVNEVEMRQPIPKQCSGPYWRMGKILPEEYISTTLSDMPPSPDGEK